MNKRVLKNILHYKKVLITHFMQLFDCQNDLSNVKSHLVFIEFFRVEEMSKKFASLHELQYQVKLFICLESVVHCGQEGTPNNFLEDLK